MGQSLALGHRQQRQGRAFDLAGRGKGPVLVVHVLDLDLRDNSQRLGVAEGRRGVFDVDVHSHVTFVPNHDGGERGFLKMTTHRVQVQVGPVSAADDELGAEPPFLLQRGVQESGIYRDAADDLPLEPGQFREIDHQGVWAGQRSQNPADQDNDAKSAGVNDTSLRQHR